MKPHAMRQDLSLPLVSPSQEGAHRPWLAWAGMGLGWSLVMLWNWRLGTALALAGATVLGQYWLTLPESGQVWQQFLKRGQQLLALAWVRSLGMGAVVLVSSYTVLSIWNENPHHWEAVAGIGQGLALLGVLGLLVVDVTQRRQMRYQADLEQCWESLQAATTQKRLLAVRRLQTLIPPGWGDPEAVKLAVEMVQLGLEREESAIVREAMLEALQMWRQPSF